MIQRMSAFVLVLALALGLAPAEANDRLTNVKSYKVLLEELPGPLRRAVTAELKRKGIEANGRMSYAAKTDGCPSNCSDDFYGGYCRCDTDAEGNCPAGTTKRGQPGDYSCTAERQAGVVSGGGLDEPIQVQTASGF